MSKAPKTEPTSSPHPIPQGPAEAAFNRIRPQAEALPKEALRRIILDPHHAASIALKIVKTLEDPDYRGPFQRMGTEFFNPKYLESLEDLALALSYARSRQQTTKATSNRRLLPAPLKREARTLKKRMLNTAAHVLSDLPEAAAEIAAIRPGIGHLDLAEDLERLAALYTKHKDILSQDLKWYSDTDAAKAKRLSAEILRAHGQRPDDDWTELTARIWTLFAEAYNQVRDTAHFIFREDESKRARFPSLFAAAKTAGQKSAATEAPEEPGLD